MSTETIAVPYQHSSAMFREYSSGLKRHSVYVTYQSKRGKFSRMRVGRYHKELQLSNTVLEKKKICSHPFKPFVKNNLFPHAKYN